MQLFIQTTPIYQVKIKKTIIRLRYKFTKKGKIPRGGNYVDYRLGDFDIRLVAPENIKDLKGKAQGI